MTRAVLGWSLCAAVLLTGVFSAAFASQNRARGDELDRLQRWCEAQARRNELARVANQRLEGELLHLPSQDAPLLARAAARAPRASSTSTGVPARKGAQL